MQTIFNIRDNRLFKFLYITMQGAWTWGSTLAEQPVRLTPREAASGLLGSVSLTMWIFLLVCYADLQSMRLKQEMNNIECLHMSSTGPSAHRKLSQRKCRCYITPVSLRLVCRRHCKPSWRSLGGSCSRNHCHCRLFLYSRRRPHHAVPLLQKP